MFGIHYENMIENVAFENMKNLEKTHRRKNKPYHLAFRLLAHPTVHRSCSLRLLPLRFAGLSPHIFRDLQDYQNGFPIFAIFQCLCTVF